ncbi:MAG: Coenzyme F420 hydrogenase/dehydrogenase, beta subunit C-terminal domain [Anaerolineae bacterium]|nr:Coenzyme F420 hydrogenase/dehydrogenase, beta subunit C-terminal domain [Anaerolineae bacterium]
MLKQESFQVDAVWQRLQKEVVEAGLCTHCGACVGLAQGQLQMQQTVRGPLPVQLPDGKPFDLDERAWAACPGKGVDYPGLYRYLFGELPQNWLIGCYRRTYVGYATPEAVRRAGASGGVITQTLLYLLETGKIDGAVVVQQGRTLPYLAESVIATTSAQILAGAQSVYQPVPVNEILGEMAGFNGRLAYVGLPDQVASLRELQRQGHPGATKVDYVLGPYVGTNMYLEAIASYLRGNGVNSLDEIAELKYRDGEWPGYLMIRLKDGRVFKAEKFYYNYLIPFFITNSTLLSVDFTNELTDISVGDAWHPRFEAQGEGFSVVVARTEKGEALLREMVDAGTAVLEETSLEDALSMHGHMIDFKKRGTFIRLAWRQKMGRRVPYFGYRPVTMPVSRKLVEMVISSIFAVCGTSLARKIVEQIPLKIIGPLFDTLRKTWKNLSKPTKRKGLAQVEFEICEE